MKTNWNELRGKRVLVKRPMFRTIGIFDSLYEAIVEEVSPEGKVKFKWFQCLTYTWEEPDAYILVEVLNKEEK